MDALADWRPRREPGRIDRIYLHWSGGDYTTTYDAYHFCVARREGALVVVETHPVAENARDVYAAPDLPYAAHVLRRNSYAIGISVMAMLEATPHDFGAYPITEESIEALCLVAARVADAYGVPNASIGTHAEAAVLDGYFGDHPEDGRWDIARLAPSPEPLHPDEARACGDRLRARIAAFQRA